MTAADIYAAGYAIPSYNVITGVYTWRYRDENITTIGLPPTHSLPGVKFNVCKIETVRKWTQ